MGKKTYIEDPEMNMTPMIDVVFLLIIFFMIVIDLTQQELENIVLPRASECAVDEEPEDYRKVVNLKQDGTIVVRRQEMTLDMLKSDLFAWRNSGLFANVNDEGVDDGFCAKPILIRTDRGTEMKHAQKIMQICGEDSLKIWKIELACSQDFPGFHTSEDPTQTVSLED